MNVSINDSPCLEGVMICEGLYPSSANFSAERFVVLKPRISPLCSVALRIKNHPAIAKAIIKMMTAPPVIFSDGCFLISLSAK